MRAFLTLFMLLFPALAFAHAEDYAPKAVAALDERSLAVPARDRIFSCDAAAMAVPILRPWVTAGVIDLSKKPSVPGEVHWDSVFSFDEGIVAGNGLPHHATGSFPVRDAAAARYDRNPNSIRPQNLSFTLPKNPQAAASPSCLSKGPIGIMLSGAALFSALDADNRDAVATEIFDSCEGHPQQEGMYHYHHYSPCFDSGAKDQPSPLLGYALDGFGIYGPRGSGGHMVTNAELDECHGAMGAVPDGKGGVKTVYHYVLNNEFPYSLGCYRGTPSSTGIAPARPQVMNGPRREMPPGHRPPDLRLAAQKLGITEEELQDALGPPPPDIQGAARTLGVTPEQLRDALGPPPGK